MLSFLKAIRKFITDCGLMTVAVESVILVKGSVDEFLQEKDFNRCKPLHPLFAQELEILNLELFINKSGSTIPNIVS